MTTEALLVYQGVVYRAREASTGQVMALKKSRVSLNLKRTALGYEAMVLRLLAGHRSIPTVFAYGRLTHFEYIAMELLGPSLGEVFQEQGKLTLTFVLDIADQMVRVCLLAEYAQRLMYASAALRVGTRS